METRFHRFLLSNLIAVASLTLFSSLTLAQEDSEATSSEEISTDVVSATEAPVSVSPIGESASANKEDVETPKVIEPNIDRRTIEIPKFDEENYEIGAFAGVLSIEDFGSNVVYGARFAYHITEDFFLEAAYGKSKAGLTSYELLSGAAALLTDSERQLSYYNLSIGYNLLPGEAFVWKNRAVPSALYLITGVGSTSFAGDDRFTLNMGFGTRLLFSDWFTAHIDMRDHLFNIDITGEDKTTHNLELLLGATAFF